MPGEALCVIERVWRRGGVVLIALLLAGAEFSVSAADFYVSPSGTTGTGPGTGTISNPWALQTALSQPAAVHPGDTIWLRSGTYTGEYASHLTGTAIAPIVVRQYPGERSTLDGNFNPLILGNHTPVLDISSGAYTWFWGFEVMNSNPNRYNPTPGSNPADARGGGINANAVGTKIINCVIHDAGGGIGFWSGATNSELYGNLIYYNGWNAPDRGHGHGIYAQHYGVSGTKLLKHNILFDPAFDGCLNMQAYGSSTAGFKNSTVDGNVFSRGEVLVGGNSGFLLTGTVVKNNGSWMTGNAFGYYCTDMTSTSYVNNYDVGARGVVSSFTPPYDHGTWGQTTITGNTFIGPLDGFTQTDFPSNTYYANPPLPTVNKVVVLPNAYETGRANIIIYNWQNLGSVAVDLTGVVSPGADYEVRNAQNFYASPVVSGTYSGGSVPLPMTGLTPATPVGYAAPPPTGPAFNIFVVLSGSLGPPVPPTASFTYSPPAPTANALVTFTDTSTGSPTMWQWTFGDGGTSTQRNPTHTYAGAGTYTVTLTVANSAGWDQTSRSLQVTLRSIPPTATRFHTLSPCRVIDTRNANGPTGGPALEASSARIFPVAGACGIPADARVVSVNLTVSNTMAPGDLRVYPPDIGIPETWTISFRAGQTRANNALLTLATDGSGTIGVKNDALGTVNVIVDVNGYFK